MSARQTIIALTIGATLAAGCKKESPIENTSPSKAVEGPTATVERPDGIDAEQWKVLQAGLGELDDAALRGLLPADADVVVEFRPELIHRAGLWRPILDALPTEARQTYQEAVDGFGGDPFARLDSVIVGISFSGKAALDGDNVKAVTIAARTHGGVLTDLYRWSKRRHDKDSDGLQARVTVLFAEDTAPEALATLLSDSDTERMQVTANSVVEREDDFASYTGPGGIVGINSNPESLASAADQVFRLLRRIHDGAARSASSDDEQLLRVKARRIPVKGKLGKTEIVVRLGESLSISGTFSAEGTAAQLDKVRAFVRDPAKPAEALRKLSEGKLELATALVKELVTNLKVGGSGDAIRFETDARSSTVAVALGGAVFGMPKEAASIGGGLNADEVFSASSNRPARLAKDAIAASALSAVQGLSVGYAKSRNGRSDRIAAWLKQEGTIEQAIGWMRKGIKWPREVPVAFADCGMVNAFYHPGEGAVLICYELVDDLLSKLRTRVKGEELGPAVIGATLFFLLHEYGHAMVHQLALPATGKEEDAVDQIATLVLLSMGEKGVRYAIAAQHWFMASESVLHKTPMWDEHSSHGQRFYTMSCLMYGSDPRKYASWAGSNWLPAKRARRCASEYAKTSAAWNALLAPHLNK